jgi:hypothetical protein
MMAAHSSPRTAKLYDRTNDAVSLDEVERVLFQGAFPPDRTGHGMRMGISRPYQSDLTMQVMK